MAVVDTCSAVEDDELHEIAPGLTLKITAIKLINLKFIIIRINCFF